MTYDPLRFCRPHRRNCLCPTCSAHRARGIHPWMTEDERQRAQLPPAPRTPEDGQTVRTPEQGRRPITRES